MSDRLEEIKYRIQPPMNVTDTCGRERQSPRGEDLDWLIAEVESLRKRCEEARTIIQTSPDLLNMEARLMEWLEGKP